MAFKDFFPPQAPTVASNSAVVLKGRRERIIAELHRWEDCGFASSADDIADRIVEQPAAALAGTPASDANPAVPEGLRERIVAELLPGVRAILANPTYLAGAVNPPSTADLICDLAADRILALIAEQPAIVVMPLEWRHDPGNGEGLYLGGLYLGGVVPQDDERYYSASSDAACFYENFEDEDRARVELEKAVRAALKDAGR